jgi:hypothetical protein
MGPDESARVRVGFRRQPFVRPSTPAARENGLQPNKDDDDEVESTPCTRPCP